jgi:hypothetical protein
VGNNQQIQVSISDGYDSATCSWTTSVVNTCSIATALPSTTTYKMASRATAETSLAAIPSDSNCQVSWTLNGNSMTWTSNGSQVSTGPISYLKSSQLTDGPNANYVVATLNNGVTTPTTRTWVITKNRTPTCSSKTHVANPDPMPFNQSKLFQDRCRMRMGIL